MANAIYPKFKESILQAGVNLSSATVKAVLVDAADYTYNAAHDFLDDIPSGARVGTPQTLSSKTFTNGVFDSANVTFPTVTGDQCEAIVLYVDSGDAATSALVAYIDTVSSGLPVTPNGGDIAVNFHSSGIFAL